MYVLVLLTHLQCISCRKGCLADHPLPRGFENCLQSCERLCEIDFGQQGKRMEAGTARPRSVWPLHVKLVWRSSTSRFCVCRVPEAVVHFNLYPER